MKVVQRVQVQMGGKGDPPRLSPDGVLRSTRCKLTANMAGGVAYGVLHNRGERHYYPLTSTFKLMACELVLIDLVCYHARMRHRARVFAKSFSHEERSSMINRL